ncbi:MAG: MlaD family protein, partial [Planctomycetota bacterium]
MRENSTYFKVGLFVLGCLALLIAGVIFISADKIDHAVLVETYIDESVQGLSVGSSVVRRGVAIGRVERITFVPVEYPMETESVEFDKFERYVMVVMAIRPTEFPQLGKDPELVSASIRKQVNNGLRFKISYQGITGLAYLEADYVDPLRNPPLAVPWVPKNHYIPSSPSLMQNFTEALDKTFQRLGAMDVEGLVTKMQS